MSAKEQLSALLATRQAGEAGSVASIQQASEHFAADSTLIPSSYGEMSKKNRNVAITNYGGFITHKFGIQPSAVYALGDVIAAKSVDQGLGYASVSIYVDFFLFFVEMLQSNFVLAVLVHESQNFVGQGRNVLPLLGSVTVLCDRCNSV